MTGALPILQLQLSPPLPSSLAPIKSRMDTLWCRLTCVVPPSSSSSSSSPSSSSYAMCWQFVSESQPESTHSAAQVLRTLLLPGKLQLQLSVHLCYKQAVMLRYMGCTIRTVQYAICYYAPSSVLDWTTATLFWPGSLMFIFGDSSLCRTRQPAWSPGLIATTTSRWFLLACTGFQCASESSTRRRCLCGSACTM